MRSLDLLDTRVPISIGGRPFTFHRITLGGVQRILVRFDAELRRFAESGGKDVDGLLASLNLKDMADLFAFMIDPYDPAFLAKHLDLQGLSSLNALAATLNDLERIWKSLTFSVPGEAQAPPRKADEIPALLYSIDRLAQRYSVSPMAILDWPYEALLTLSELAHHQDQQAALAAGGVDRDLLDDSGITHGPIPDLNKLVN